MPEVHSVYATVRLPGDGDWHNSDIPARTPDVCFRG
jgi:hypothetical protein